MANNRIDKINVGGADYDIGSTNFVFDTYAEYRAAYSAGDIPVGSVVYIKEGSTDNTITALQVVYNNGTVKSALDKLNSDLSLKTRIVGVKNCHSNIATNSKFHVKEYGKIIEYSSQASDGFHIYGSLPANTKVCDIDDSNIPGYSNDYVLFTGIIISSGATVSNLHYHSGGIYTNVALSHGDARIVFSFKVLKET